MTIDVEELQRRRKKSLLVKWSTGARLTPTELAEIADLLPQAPAPKPELQLEAQVEGESGNPYKERRETYAERFGQSVRTINRWMKTAAPLDDPPKMPAWWARNYKHRVPAVLLELASAAPTEVASAAVAMTSASETNQVLDDVVTLSPIQQARRIADMAYARLERAQRGLDSGEVVLAQRAHKDASEQLRRMELADPKIRAAAGKVVDRERLRVFLTEMHTSLAQALRSFCKRVRGELVGKTPVQQEALWQDELDKLFASFRNCEFADPLA
jgi:hypothetical protein